MHIIILYYRKPSERRFSFPQKLTTTTTTPLLVVSHHSVTEALTFRDTHSPQTSPPIAVAVYALAPETIKPAHRVVFNET